MKDKKCYKCESTENIRLVNPRNPLSNNFICKPCNNKKEKQYYDKYKYLVFEHYGNICACCGETIFEFLSIDHVNNDGQYDKNANGKRLGGRHLYPRIAKSGYPKKYQLLCMNCNFGKRMNGGICPHKSIDTNM